MILLKALIHVTQFRDVRPGRPALRHRVHLGRPLQQQRRRQWSGLHKRKCCFSVFSGKIDCIQSLDTNQKVIHILRSPQPTHHRRPGGTDASWTSQTTTGLGYSTKSVSCSAMFGLCSKTVVHSYMYRDFESNRDLVA